MIKTFPLLFILLWSSAFITGKVIVEDASPFAALTFRFGIVTIGFFIYSIFKKEVILNKFKNIIESISSGILFHGLYLGGCFYAFNAGVPPSIVALIVTIQPILTNLLSGPIYKEEINFKQWIGIALGFSGSVLVLGLDMGREFPKDGIITCFVALSAITAATLWQKKLSGNLSMSVSNGYQAMGGCIFNLILMIIFEKPFINFSLGFILGMSHQIFLVSFGAFTILMILIKEGTVGKTTSLFFLVPPTSAIMDYFFLDQYLSKIDILGFILATIGVYIATRKHKD